MQFSISPGYCMTAKIGFAVTVRSGVGFVGIPVFGSTLSTAKPLTVEVNTRVPD